MIDFRREYRVPSDEQKLSVEAVKNLAEQLDRVFEDFGVLPGDRDRMRNIARTHLETAVMFAVKAVS